VKLHAESSDRRYRVPSPPKLAALVTPGVRRPRTWSPRARAGANARRPAGRTDRKSPRPFRCLQSSGSAEIPRRCWTVRGVSVRASVMEETEQMVGDPRGARARIGLGGSGSSSFEGHAIHTVIFSRCSTPASTRPPGETPSFSSGGSAMACADFRWTATVNRHHYRHQEPAGRPP